ncbi:hypothetical protein LXL04_023153 [Taraxacum kok-saghyz]
MLFKYNFLPILINSTQKMFFISVQPSLCSSTASVLVTISIIIIFIFFGKCLINKTSSNQPPLPPGPTPLPFIGCTIQLLLNRPTFRWIHKLMAQFKTTILCIRLGASTHVIAVSCPNLACEFLRKQDVVFSSRPETLSTYLVSNGYQTTVLSPPGDQWKKMRAILIHDVLAPPIHKWLQPKRDEEANQLLSYVCNQIENPVTDGLVNIRNMSHHYFGNLIRMMIFGTRFFGGGMEDGGPGEEETEHVASVFTILKYLYAFSIIDFFPWLRGKTDFEGHQKIIRTAIQKVRKYQDPLIDERIQMWKDGVRKAKDDVLDVLINHESPKLTAQEIKAQILELMLAAIDNPANAIEWVMAEMMNEPTILIRAVAELDHEVGRDRLVEEQDLPKLNYIKACIKEAFRMHPFAPFNFPHVSMRDTTVAGYFIPKGSHILLSRLGLGRNPNAWTDPMRFDPNRHLNVEGKQVVLSDNELRMLSFSTGRRGCPGVVLGSTTTTMMLARMVQGFIWEVPYNYSPIKLVENQDDLGLAKPLELMLAAIDNPANAIEWVMAEMMNEPTILKRAVAELDHEVGRDRLVEEQDLPKLNYIKACIKEAFRMHPFAPFNFPHVSMRDTTVAGYFIPKGSHILLSRLGLGRNPNAWTDPMRFDPNRHLNVEGKQVVLSDNELRMLSFSTGRRGCLGVVLGSTTTTMMLARMV